ncbi:Uncharacterised protein [Yersinia similis]|uniref:Uncharacterized protein n=1 Tax=Yersinia similis TaxID=367190 RepID=A0A0T9Q4X0_9GAMM|nr:Uncharacterised protein [Yersinia similis]CNB28297.1 Uncharacterised protein [Yersinia similis]CNF34105.1 Uncharacterised protein [Yersinia similis]CNH96273.1 Uncharacterised protein [Yersinia similis]
MNTANTAVTLSKKGGKHKIKKAAGAFIPPTAIILKHKKTRLLDEQ